jgi:WD40 repeat protein
LEGASVIYDIRTTTRSVVLEGHTGPVVALAFSPDAKLIATCSLLDQSVRIWHTNMSLFGMLTSSLTNTSSQKKDSSGAHKPDKVFTFALPNSKKKKKKFQIFVNVYFV